MGLPSFGMGLGDTLISFIRTYVPVYVGVALTALQTFLFDHHVLGFAINTQAAGLWATGAVIGVYYAAARILEKKWPVFGFLLGARSQPKYSPATDLTAKRAA